MNRSNNFVKLLALSNHKVLVCFLAFSCFFFGFEQNSYGRNESFKARVYHIVDGDSLLVKTQGKKIAIRLYGIDTPEENQPFSRNAERFTRRLSQNRIVVVHPVERDDYGRLVARVIVGRTDISQELVRSGLAWVHIYYCRKSICNSWKVLEKKARRGRIGLWQDKQPIAPWEWKKLNRFSRKKRY